MTALRQLSLVYVLAAGAYAMAMAMSAHPVWQKDVQFAGAYVAHQSGMAAGVVNRRVFYPGWVLAENAADGLSRRIVEAVIPGRHAPRSTLTRMANAVPAPVRRIARALPVSHHGLPSRLAPERTAALDVRRPPAAAHRLAGPAKLLTIVPSASVPSASAPSSATASLPPVAPAFSPADIIRVTQRLRDGLTSEMLANFELFLYVSKADAGPWAQHMYVFQKQTTGDLKLLYNWPVSTGRERLEFNPAGRKLATDTPPGYYELDPHRSYAQYNSAEWGKPMPYAMFFNWVKDGNETGLAIHAASGDDQKLIGKRASAGCIHLTEDNARTLFTLIRTQYRGLAPRFAVDRRTGTMSNDGILLHDAQGHLKLAEGYKVLIFIEDYGGENVVAALF